MNWLRRIFKRPYRDDSEFVINERNRDELRAYFFRDMGDGLLKDFQGELIKKPKKKG